MAEISISQIQQFINSKTEGAVGGNNISLSNLFSTAQIRDIELNDGDYVAPHKLSEFYGSKFLTLLGPSYTNVASAPDASANYQFSAGSVSWVQLSSSIEHPTWLGDNRDHGPFTNNRPDRFYHIVRIGVNGTCTYQRIHIYSNQFWQNLTGTWSGGGQDGTQPITATFINELPVNNRTRTDPVSGSVDLIDYFVLGFSAPSVPEVLENYTGPFGGTETLTFNPPAGGWEAARNATSSSPLSVFGERLTMQTNTVDGVLYEYSAYTPSSYGN